MLITHLTCCLEYLSFWSWPALLQHDDYLRPGDAFPILLLLNNNSSSLKQNLDHNLIPESFEAWSVLRETIFTFLPHSTCRTATSVLTVSPGRSNMPLPFRQLSWLWHPSEERLWSVSNVATWNWKGIERRKANLHGASFTSLLLIVQQPQFEGSQRRSASGQF